MSSWFDEARLGLFVHWGHYATAGWEASWPLVGGVATLPHGQRLDVETYHANAKRFRPKPNAPAAWVEAAARAGARYAIMTTRHHDGFAMWPTATSEYSIELGGYAGDPVREFVEACRTHGLRIGFYYSLPDWHHPDYPAYTEADKPYVFGRYPAARPDQWERYMAYLEAQLQELLTHYGPVDIVWFDGAWERTQAQWQCDRIEHIVRTLQPGVLINDRLPDHGDYATPEQFIPPKALPGRWETCLTMNESWGYNPGDTSYKSPSELIHTLCEVAGRGGNLLLNVSPDGNGDLVPEQRTRLEAIARWTRRHGDAVFSTDPGLEPWQFYGPSTRKANTLYAHLLMKPVERVAIRGVPVNHVRSVKALGTGRDLRFDRRIPVTDTLFGTDPRGELLVTIPTADQEPDATVIAVEFDIPF
ncbi:MAG: alpha-L-fucosidase [Gammaproteobacteria bacterium]